MYARIINVIYMYARIINAFYVEQCAGDAIMMILDNFLQKTKSRDGQKKKKKETKTLLYTNMFFTHSPSRCS
jgi:hypothetical protein